MNVPIRCCDIRDFRDNSQTKKDRVDQKRFGGKYCKIDMSLLGVSKDVVTDRMQWCKGIHTVDST